MSAIKVLVVDDHKIFREGVVSLLERESDISIVGEATNGKEALTRLEDVQPDIVLMDISMGEHGGIEATKAITQVYPGIKVIALTMHEEIEYILRIIDAGAKGYFLKDTGSYEMFDAIRTVANGGSYYSQKASALLMSHLQRKERAEKDSNAMAVITPREKEILTMVVQEYSNAEIAEALFISIRTVNTHKRNILEKLRLKNMASLIKYAIANGLVKEQNNH